MAATLQGLPGPLAVFAVGKEPLPSFVPRAVRPDLESADRLASDSSCERVVFIAVFARKIFADQKQRLTR